MAKTSTFAAVIALLGLAGCGGRTQVKAPQSTLEAGTAEAVKARAGKAFEAHDRESGVAPVAKKPVAENVLAAPTGTSVDEAGKNEVQARRGKVLGTDPEGCTWVEGESSVAAGEQDSKHQVRAAAVEQARAAAVQDFLGVDVKSKFMDFQQEGLRTQSSLTESILQTTRSGRILKEAVLDEGFSDMPGCPACRYRVKLKACVVPREAASDKDFHVELELSRVRFVQGDEAKIKVTATRDCSIYLYDVYGLGSQEKTALVVPNEIATEKRLKAGESWEYPDEEARKRGVRLVAEFARPTDEISAEIIRVVASKTPLPKSVYDPVDGGWFGVMRRLNRSKVEWMEDAEAFTIYKR
ncbi:MAG: hypothetical protein A2V88_17750 [Elusimicrobia bacterium RBG_16_66_12]|nr:MAG: hypothetical protein A2V88_17750 [Elusimicrobia bacterium RBG_16_66_12]